MNQQQLEIAQKVIERICYKYTFGPYDVDDIRQEALIFALEAMDEWDGSRPLENFLAVVLPNRLKNLKRDEYFRPGPNKFSDKKKALMETSTYYDNETYDEQFAETMGSKHAVDLVLDKLPISIRSDFLRLANGVSVPKVRKEKVYEAVREILGGESEHF